MPEHFHKVRNGREKYSVSHIAYYNPSIHTLDLTRWTIDPVNLLILLRTVCYREIRINVADLLAPLLLCVQERRPVSYSLEKLEIFCNEFKCFSAEEFAQGLGKIMVECSSLKCLVLLSNTDDTLRADLENKVLELCRSERRPEIELLFYVR